MMGDKDTMEMLAEAPKHEEAASSPMKESTKSFRPSYDRMFEQRPTVPAPRGLDETAARERHED